MDTQSAEDTVDIDLGGVSSIGEAIGDLGDDMATVLTGLELNGLVLKVANMDCVGKFLEFDLLCGVLGSEVVDKKQSASFERTLSSYKRRGNGM
ncbi:hypothetical protein JHK82_022429 [Glycine max]|nr:hypothetical protein JHK87_022341 [Glycine soja]KAG5016781.1 hypothetical protein JHK85_022917 [Glycine max]KAG5137698.1 hypothetical protein JHK82_022429 [Glycine max]